MSLISKYLINILVLSVFLTESSFGQESLKQLFAEDFLIGASLNKTQFYDRDKIASNIVDRHFNTITPENALKWESLHPSNEVYEFDDADKYVDFGERRKMFIVGHALIWHNQVPKSVFEDANGKPVSRKTLLDRMRSHIRAVVGRYKGRIGGWDVVNEALEEDGTLRKTPWLSIIGEDYIAKAFEFAHEADPEAELYYNDYSIENEPKRRGAIALIEKLLAKGIPVNAIGLQGHNNFSFPTLAQQEKTIEEFAKLGIKVMITELDVSVLPDPEGFAGAEVSTSFEMKKRLDPYRSGLPGDVGRRLAKRYVDLFRIYKKHRATVQRITFWNVTDGDSWLNDFPVRGRTNYPLLFDRHGKPKLALRSLIEEFRMGKNKKNPSIEF